LDWIAERGLRMEQQNWKGIIESGEGLTGEREWKLWRRDENVMDIFRPYSRSNPFRGVLIRPYSSSDI
jgi:hypothetical protein